MENNNKSSLPIALIGIVLLAAVGFGFWFYSSSKTNGTTSNKVDNTAKAPAGIPANAPPGASPAWTKGSPTAAVTIEEFADFQCPTCATMHPKVNEVRAAFGDRVKIIFRQFPLQMHPHAYNAAVATEAAGMQGKFWEMQNMIFTNQTTWANSTDARKIFTEYAKTLGLDLQKFEDDSLGLATKNRVDADLKRGQASGVASTPAFYINGKPLGRDLDSLRSTVEAELKRVEGGSQTTSAPANATNTNATNK
jgi:protein-disulfide isomerase